MTHSIKFQNYHINYYVEGSGEAVLFLHGWPTNSRLWNAQVEQFKTNYKTITIDWLGFGKSDKPAIHKYTFSKKKEILDAVLKSILKNDEKINIIAHDVGGPPAILWASENQTRVNRLILLNTILFPFSTTLDKMSHFFFRVPILKNILMSNFGLRTLIKTLSKSRGRNLKNRVNDVIGWHDDLKTKIKLKTILEPVEEGLKNELHTLAKKYTALNVQKYLVIAKRDPLCFAHMKKIIETNPNIPKFILSNSGHFIPVDRPDELNKILFEIFRK